MLEIDNTMSYIFGSFARRRQSQEVGTAKRRSIEPTKISHDRSNSTPHTPKKALPSSTRARSVCNVIIDESKFKCPMCRRLFVEPKVLPCLHTFCLRCIQELEAHDYSSWCDNGSDGKLMITLFCFNVKLNHFKSTALLTVFCKNSKLEVSKKIHKSNVL